MRGTIFMMRYEMKKVNAIIAAVGLALTIAEWITGFTLIPGLTSAMHLALFSWLTVAGLLMVAFTMEKVEDERVKLIRSRAMMKGFMITCATLLAFAFNLDFLPVLSPRSAISFAVTTKDYTSMGMVLMLFPMYTIVSYLILFHYSLYNDERFEFDELPDRKKRRKNKTGKFKRVMIAIAAVALALTIAEWVLEFTFIPHLTPGMHLALFSWLTTAALLLVASSMEKIEDERVQLIRSKAMMKGFMMTCASILAFSLNLTLIPAIAPKSATEFTVSAADYTDMGMLIMFFPLYSVVSYLGLFHFGLYNDEHFEFNDYLSRKENFKKNKKYIIGKLVVSTLLVFLLFYFIRLMKKP